MVKRKTKFKTLKEYDDEIEYVRQVIHHSSELFQVRDQIRYLDRLYKERQVILNEKINSNSDWWRADGQTKTKV